MSYVQDTSNENEKIFGSLCTNRKYLVLYSTLTRDNPDRKWITAAVSKPRASQSSLSRFDWAQTRLFTLVGYELSSTLSHRRNAASFSLFYYDFDVEISNKLYSLVPPTLTLTAKTHLAAYTEANRTHSFRIPLGRSKFYFTNFLPRTATLCNRLPRWCFSDH